jgi:hypothetical protein
VKCVQLSQNRDRRRAGSGNEAPAFLPASRAKLNLNHIYRPNSYGAVNILRLGYKTQQLNGV